MRMEKIEGINGNTIINDTYTFDQKSLEISVNYISNRHKLERKVLIIPSSNANTANTLLLQSFDQIILIGEKINGLNNLKKVYDSIHEFWNYRR